MSSYNIALNFEDGVTRFVECKAGEKVLDAAFRAKINLPMDCSDGVCGTCKCRAESGSYDLGDDYIEDALSDDEKESGLVLTCQMVPQSDCVIAVPASSTACKTEQSKFAATVSKVEPHNDAAVVLELDVDATAPVFLPGQYVNIDVPGSGQHRSYSFSSAPGESKISFLIKKIPGGVMSTWLESAQAGNKVELTGPLGSFYLRAVERPLLFLAGGTGLAPFLSMLEVLARGNSMPGRPAIRRLSEWQEIKLYAGLTPISRRGLWTAQQGRHLVFEILKAAFGGGAATGGAIGSARGGRRGGGSGATGGAPTRGSPGSVAGRRSAASSRCAISARFWSAEDIAGADGGGGGGWRRGALGARTGGAFGASLGRDGRGIIGSLRGVTRGGIGSLRSSGRGSGRPPNGSGVKPASGSLRRSGTAGAGRRTSSAKEGRAGRGGSGICGSA